MARIAHELAIEFCLSEDGLDHILVGMAQQILHLADQDAPQSNNPVRQAAILYVKSRAQAALSRTTWTIPEDTSESSKILKNPYELQQAKIQALLIQALSAQMDLLLEMGRPDTPEAAMNELARLLVELKTTNTIYQRKAAISKELRQEVLNRNEHRCVLCGSTIDLTVDHIFPEVFGGHTAAENLQTLCRVCNTQKGVGLS